MTSLTSVAPPAQDDAVAQVCRRVDQLRQAWAWRNHEKDIIRAVCSSPEEGLRAIVGDLGDTNPYAVPAANMVLSGLNRYGQKLGRIPDLRVDAPDDKERSRKSAEHRARMITMWDEETDLEGVLNQSGMWLPTYTMTGWVVKEGHTEDGEPYPAIVNLDPYGMYPAPSIGRNQPRDLAYCYTMPASDLAKKYPQHRIRLLGQRQSGGAILLDPTTAYPSSNTWFGSSTQGNPTSAGLEVAEYYNEDGCWVVIPSKNLLLEYYENPLPSPQFWVNQTYSVSKPVGKYDHAIGLQTVMAQMSALMVMAFQDAVHTETNISGDVLSGQYRKGRFALNILAPGTRVEKPVTNIPYQWFQATRDLENQFRVAAGYSPVDDAISPAAQATGQGIDRLTAGLDLEVKRDLSLFRRGQTMIDRKRLQWAEICYGDRTLQLAGVRGGESFAGSYNPKKDINGQYRTRRTYGMMAGLDDHNKISALSVLMGSDLLDQQSAMEELDLGDRSVTKVQERIRQAKAEKFLMEAMVSGAPVDPRVALTLIELLPESEMKERFRKFWTPAEPQMSPEEEAFLGAQQAPQGPPDLAAALGLGGPPMPGGPPPAQGPPPDLAAMLGAA